MPKFSILVAHYQHDKYFYDCYKSICSQTIQDFEVIVVDDFSHEKSYTEIQKISGSNGRFKFFRNDRNRGVGFTKKKCIDLASGEICLFLDPDDALVPTALEDSAAQLTEKYIATHSQYYRCDHHLNILGISKHTQVDNQSPVFFNIQYEVAHLFCFKKAAYEKCIPLDESLSSATDQDLYLKLAEKGQFKFIKKPLYYYRLHHNGISQKSNKKKLLRKNWNKVLADAAQRRKLTILYNRPINDIDNLAMFIFDCQNTFWKRIRRRLL